MTSFAYIFMCPFTLLHLLPTVSSLWMTASKGCSLRKTEQLLKGLSFLFLFLKSRLTNHSLVSMKHSFTVLAI